MIKSHTSELSRLGVPFFNTSPELVGSGGVEEEDDGKGGLIRIKENELKKLREKMIHLIEDLCSEWDEEWEEVEREGWVLSLVVWDGLDWIHPRMIYICRKSIVRINEAGVSN